MSHAGRGSTSLPERPPQLGSYSRRLKYRQAADFHCSVEFAKNAQPLADRGRARAAYFVGRGDDGSDETAMEAARLGGEGLTVAGEHFPAASADFAGPAQVFAWLEALARPCP